MGPASTLSCLMRFLMFVQEDFSFWKCEEDMIHAQLHGTKCVFRLLPVLPDCFDEDPSPVDKQTQLDHISETWFVAFNVTCELSLHHHEFVSGLCFSPIIDVHVIALSQWISIKTWLTLFEAVPLASSEHVFSSTGRQSSWISEEESGMGNVASASPAESQAVCSVKFSG